jgi:hypothetical protein
MLRTKMPPLNPTPLYNSPLHDLEIIASQQDVRHVKSTFNNNPATAHTLERFLCYLHSPTSLTPGIQGLIQAKYHTAAQSRSIVHSFLKFCANTLDPDLWRPYPTLLLHRSQNHTPNILMWAISIRNLPIAFLHNLRYLPVNNHATRPVTTLAPQNEPPANKRHRFSITQEWLHETNRPLTTPLNPPTRPPMETAITPTLDVYVPALPDEDDGNAPTLVPPHAPLSTPHGQPPPPSAYRITTDTPGDASKITCTNCLQTPNARLTAPCLTTSASCTTANNNTHSTKRISP